MVFDLCSVVAVTGGVCGDDRGVVCVQDACVVVTGGLCGDVT